MMTAPIDTGLAALLRQNATSADILTDAIRRAARQALASSDPYEVRACLEKILGCAENANATITSMRERLGYTPPRGSLDPADDNVVPFPGR